MSNAIILEPTALSSVTPSTTATGYSGANVGNDYMGLTWQSTTGSATQSLTIDLGADTAVDTIILLGLANASQSWQWAVDLATAAQGGFGGSYWAGSAETLLAGATAPVSGLGKAIWQDPGTAPAAARYVRLNFSSLGTSAIEVARVVIGEKIQLAQNIRYGAAFGVRPMGKLDLSARGVILRRRGKKLRGVGISYDAATRAEIESDIQPLLERVGNDETVCIVIDPDADAQRQNRIYYGFLTGDLGTIWARVGGFTASINLVALD